MGIHKHVFLFQGIWQMTMAGIYPSICGPPKRFGKLQLTCLWPGVFQFCSCCFFQLISPRHVARTQTAVPFLASGPTIYPSFGPRSGPTSAYPLNLVRQVGQSLWVSLRSSLETEESFQSAVMSICSDQSYLSLKAPYWSMVESLLTNRVSSPFSVCLYNSELPPPKVTTRPDKSWKDQRGKRPDQFWLFIPEHGFARGIIA